MPTNGPLRPAKEAPHCPNLFWTSGLQHCLKLPGSQHLEEVQIGQLWETEAGNL